MTTEEMDIVTFLKQYPDTFFTRKEIARKARHKSDYEANPHWAAAPLASLVMQNVVEQSESGHYKIIE